MSKSLREVFEADGILVGYYGTAATASGKPVRVFIPRRERDIEADRALISGLFKRLRESPKL